MSKPNSIGAGADENALIADAVKAAEETLSWSIIDRYFKDNPNVLVRHHLESYNDFLSNGIARIMKDRNPIILEKDENNHAVREERRRRKDLGKSMLTGALARMAFTGHKLNEMDYLYKTGMKGEG